ncbi:L,D-transpeptidase family protein [Candidatus Kaiserbacteria bacterium]|nr:L,D-transpeptidase family protein [Candidatus Kaiserbacteria bacterium]
MQRFWDLRFSALSSALVFVVSLTALLWIAFSVSTQSAEGPLQDLEGEAAAELRTEIAEPMYEYLEVMNGCDYAYVGDCVSVRAGPGFEYKIVDRLRKGIVLKIGDTVSDGARLWYKIAFDEPIRYPERVERNQYVAAENVRHFYDDGVRELQGMASPSKRIVVDRSSQTLYAFDGEQLFMEASISTGINLTPTPRGNFFVYKKTPTRYMQGPLPAISDKYYDLPGVPWNLYFTNEGGVIHGAYWHESFGKRWSNGCVNLPLTEARTLYEWADIGTPVHVRD